MEVRVRFAPSPTGRLHVGGLRTALYNWLFAKKHGGKTILRLEDTDRTRFVENAAENLMESLSWAGVTFDEKPVDEGPYGPYVQSLRLDIYKLHADMLLSSGSAYYAFDTPQELDEMRQRLQKEKKDFKYDRYNMRNSLTLSREETEKILESGALRVVRLLVKTDEDIVFKDIIRGEIRVKGSEVDDQILLKSDGFPTYHLANVVDDYLMKITHVIRGEEWLPSTPKHVLLYKAFGWDMPEFAHLPLLLNKDKSKLSKRQGSVAVEDFREKGYLKDAFVNFIALLGWNPTGDRDIYDLQELIDMFNLEKVNKGGSVFDTKKLDWMNMQYLKKTPASELVESLEDALKKKGFELPGNDYMENVIELFIERITFVSDIPEDHPYMFEPPAEYEEKYMNKHWKENTADLVKPLTEMYKSVENFTHGQLHEMTKNYIEENNLKFKDIVHPLRLMITGRSAGAGMFETMQVLGREECISRIETFLEKKEKGAL